MPRGELRQKLPPYFIVASDEMLSFPTRARLTSSLNCNLLSFPLMSPCSLLLAQACVLRARGHVLDHQIAEW
jgi:hypothetical protein